MALRPPEDRLNREGTISDDTDMTIRRKLATARPLALLACIQSAAGGDDRGGEIALLRLLHPLDRLSPARGLRGPRRRSRGRVSGRAPARRPRRPSLLPHRLDRRLCDRGPCPRRRHQAAARRAARRARHRRARHADRLARHGAGQMSASLMPPSCSCGTVGGRCSPGTRVQRLSPPPPGGQAEPARQHDDAGDHDDQRRARSRRSAAAC